MPFKEVSVMDQRRQLVAAVEGGELGVSAAAARAGVSRTTAYGWIARTAEESELAERSRRPHTSPLQTSAEHEAAVSPCAGHTRPGARPSCAPSWSSATPRSSGRR